MKMFNLNKKQFIEVVNAAVACEGDVILNKDGQEFDVKADADKLLLMAGLFSDNLNIEEIKLNAKDPADGLRFFNLLVGQKTA